MVVSDLESLVVAGSKSDVPTGAPRVFREKGDYLNARKKMH